MPGSEEAKTPHAGNAARWLLLGGIGAGFEGMSSREEARSDVLAFIMCCSLILQDSFSPELELQTAAVMKLSQLNLISEEMLTGTKKGGKC